VDIDATSTVRANSGSAIITGITYGLLPTRTRAVLQGAHARVRTTQRAPAFWFCFEESQAELSSLATGMLSPSEFQLIAFKVRERRDDRTFETGRFAIWGGRTGPSSRQLRDTAVDKVKPGVYRISAERLQPGEYGFYAIGAGAYPGPFAMAMGLGMRVFPFAVDDA
jgi:hypothetical protein